jgi:hypothetical protein
MNQAISCIRFLHICSIYFTLNIFPVTILTFSLSMQNHWLQGFRLFSCFSSTKIFLFFWSVNENFNTKFSLFQSYFTLKDHQFLTIFLLNPNFIIFLFIHCKFFNWREIIIWRIDFSFNKFRSFLYETWIEYECLSSLFSLVIFSKSFNKMLWVRKRL